MCCTGAAYATDSYDPAGHVLDVAVLRIGTATFSNVFLSVGSVLTPPNGTSPNFGVDVYNPANHQLSVASVSVGASTYYSAVVSVSGLVSIGGVSGADTYDGAHLTIPQVQVGGAIYANVVITVGRIISPGGGMPQQVGDVYDATTRQLQIAAIQLGSTVYTNAIVTVGQVLSVGGRLPVESVMHSFNGNGGVLVSTDGAQPYGNLVQGSDGNFYGTTLAGGTYNQGTVFRLTAAGVLTVLHSFSGNGGQAGSVDGAGPEGALVAGNDGNYYGTTSEGGTYDVGTIFRITPQGVVTVLHSFSGNGGLFGSNDGAVPYAGLTLGKDGRFYGTTPLGGQYLSGTVFSLTPPSATQPVAYGVLYSFSGNSGMLSSADGAYPYAGLVQGSDGNFYGTTEVGGGVNDSGTVFMITPGGAETVLYSFGATPTDGTYPWAGLAVGANGNFYGTTAQGGANGSGSVFMITPSRVLTTIYAFSGNGGVPGSPDGSTPYASLVLGSDGNFYGTTTLGGAYDAGSVFRISPTGAETLLYSFSGNGALSGSNDAASPVAGLIRGSDGNFYGAAAGGGAFGQGALFRLTGVITTP